MPFVEPITIKEAVDSVHKKDYLLPAIQREFVWSTYQIARLFDSLMREYPINSFLFWTVDKENIKNYQFYEFVREYHGRDNTHNPKANVDGESGITAILDGQQRLTSLYIGLKGTYADKLPRKRWDNDSAFPKRTLCLNLISPSEDNDFEYDFQFLTEKEYTRTDDTHVWFLIGDILNLKEGMDVNEYLVNNLVNNEIADPGKEKFRYASRTLFKLHAVIHTQKSINFFLEKDKSLDKVLNIFIRINSGGTQLSYSDLLLSIATAQWKEKDAREEIISFVDEINAIDGGGGFNLDKDFVLKNCLVLSKLNIAFKVDNFTQENMRIIEEQWDAITKAIKSSVVLVSSLGYQRDTLPSKNALIPIATYLYKIGSPDNFSESSKYEADRKKIFKWLIMVFLKRTFSGTSDNVLNSMRDVINQSKDNFFPIDEIISKLRGTIKAISFDDDDIDYLINHQQYGQAHTYSSLAFLYPTLDFRNKFHQDHIFPKKLFNEKTLRKRGIDDDYIEFYLGNYNYLGNIQLLEGVPNQEKSGADFDVWIKEKYPKKDDRKAYMERNYIPDINLSLENFEEFIEERDKLIASAFKKLLDK